MLRPRQPPLFLQALVKSVAICFSSKRLWQREGSGPKRTSSISTADTACSTSASDADGNLYGVGGGTAMPNGTVCELIRPRAAGESWKFTNLYAFKGVARNKSIGDGSGPLGVTFDNKGNLWGATASGGFCQLFEGGSCFGTLFLLTPPSAPAGAWTESVLHRFNNGNQNPISGVTIDKSGALYGVTYVETYRFFNGALTVIGTFSDCSGCGYAPTGGVVLDDAGNVYGVTAAGGQFGYGTVYELAMPDYSQVVLHSFAAGTDGWNPEEPLILGPNGALYGTTQDGGNQGCQLGFGSVGCGIVFELVPASGNGRPDRGGEPQPPPFDNPPQVPLARRKPKFTLVCGVAFAV